MNSKAATVMSDMGYRGFKRRIFSSEWVELIERDWLEREMGVEERMDRFLRTLEEIRELPCSR